MTESEWLTATEPTEMLRFAWAVDLRKLRLFVCACCRSQWSSLSTKRSRKSIEVAERYADGKATEQQLSRAWSAGSNPAEWLAGHSARPELEFYHIVAWTCSDYATVTSKVSMTFLRDIFGNPFRPITLNPAWFTPTVLVLANGIYEERAFDRMPILADALQDADCDNDDILKHCRQPSEHVRGCWVVDLLLNKM